MLAVRTPVGVEPRLRVPRLDLTNVQQVLDDLDAGRPAALEISCPDDESMRADVPACLAHNTLGHNPGIASHPLLAKNVTGDLRRLANIAYAHSHRWEEREYGPWEEHIGLPADRNVPVTGEHLRLLEPVYPTVRTLYDACNAGRWKPCTLGALARQVERRTPHYAWTTATPMNPKATGLKVHGENEAKSSHEQWDGMYRVFDKRSGQHWVYPLTQMRDWTRDEVIGLLRDEAKQGGLPDSADYPFRGCKGTYAIQAPMVEVQRRTILLDGEPVGEIVCEPYDNDPLMPHITRPVEWCWETDGGYGEFLPSFQQAMIDFIRHHETD